MKNRKNIFLIKVISIFAASFTFAEAKEHIVKVISDYDHMRMVFEPKILKVDLGDTVTWINMENETHNVLSYPDGYPKGGTALKSQYFEKKGDKWSFTFNKVEGVYEYHCIPHVMMGMRGKIIVGNPSHNIVMNIPTYDERKAYRNMMLEFFDEEDFDRMPAYVAERLKDKRATHKQKAEK